jgi:phosphoglycerol transferase MdoB-like AlkP superfamily enzyme
MGHAGFGFRMVLDEPRFFVFFFIFLVVSWLYLWLLRKLRKKHEQYLPSKFDVLSNKQIALIALAFVVLLIFNFLGIRGRTEEKSPILVGTAYFSNNPFINQLGLNPVFTLLRSWLDSNDPQNRELHWIDDKVALQIMSQLLHHDPRLDENSPIARMQHNDAICKGRNVVLVIMESMSAAKMNRFGSKDNITPFLDSLTNVSWSFDSTFSAGLHTYNGIYTSLFAHPALMKRHTMELVTIPKTAGFPNTLKRQGYQTIFFTTHDEMFDNMSGFLSANDVDIIVGEKNYPSAEIKSTLGVPDEFMFRFSIPKLNELSAKGKPFFAAFMTGSDHDPHVIPTDHGFVPPKKKESLQIVAYADWSLRKFVEYASKQSWYNNTVFVFVADHGANWGTNAYDITFSYHHIPFVIFAPGVSQPKTFLQLSLQSDVFPTVSSLVVDSFVNNSFGINLFQEKHDCIVFSADDKLACMNDSMLYFFRLDGGEKLFRYRHNDLTDYAHRYPQLTKQMHQTACSWLQTSQWLLKNDKTRLP